MSGLELVEQAAGAAGLRLRRAWPRSADHLLLDLVPRGQHLAPGSGPPVAGQWFADADRAREVAERTGPAATLLPGAVVLQPGGADRRLAVLAELLTRTDAELVAHRPERRAVVRRADGAYVKVVRPARTAGVARAASRPAPPGVRVPRVTGVEPARGLVTTEALPGRTLHDLLGDPGVPETDAVRAASGVGSALARLHAAPLPAEVEAHDVAAEAGVAGRWLAHALSYRALTPEAVAAVEGALASARRLLAGPAQRPRLLHRDLHDKQVLLAPDSQVGLLDFDLAAGGEPALDLANLLVHLELRGAQGRVAPERAAACSAAVLEAYAPDRGTRQRLAGYDLLSRARLVCVYAFRPGSTSAAGRLLPPCPE